MFKQIRKSILAALCISVGCMVNLMCADKGFPIIGAFYLRWVYTRFVVISSIYLLERLDM